MAEPRIVTAIDIGSSKVVSLMGEAMAAPGEFSVIGVGVTPARGMKRGQIINVAEATAAIRESLDGAERSSALKVNSAIVSISGSHIASQNSHGAVAISRGDQGVSLNDINHSLESAQAIAVPNNREIIHVIPRHFKVDEQDGVRNPIGMLGFRLEVQAHIVTGATTSIQNLIKCANAARIEVSELVLTALGSAEAVLTSTEREMGVVLVDIGNGTTDIAIFIDGSVWHTRVLEIGGAHFTSDLALCLRLPLETAEQIKLANGHCNPDDLPLDNPFIVAGFGDAEKVSVYRREVAEILRARAEELFGLILQEIKRSGYDGLLPAGLVITGGGALLPGLRDVARDVTNLPVRIAQPTDLHGLVDTLHSPAYSTAIGLLKWGMHDIVARPSKRRRPTLNLDVKSWWSNLLPKGG